MERIQIYETIDLERQYQLRQQENPNSHVVENFPLGSALTAIRYNLDMAEKAWYLNRTPHEETMEYLRKIAAIIVGQAEQNGMPQR